MDINDIKNYMTAWSKYNYDQGLDFCRDADDDLKEIAYEILDKQNLSPKIMNGNSVQGIPIIEEGDTRNILFSYIFYSLLEQNYLTPASYILKIVEKCEEAGIDRDTEAGLVGRGLRSFPSFIREVDLAAKLVDQLDGASCDRVGPSEDIKSHTDVLLDYNGTKYRIWSYQNTSDKALYNTGRKLRGFRGELPSGIYVLCPFNFQNANDYEDHSGWRLHSASYVNNIIDVINSGNVDNYISLLNMDENRLRNYIVNAHVVKKD